MENKKAERSLLLSPISSYLLVRVVEKSNHGGLLLLFHDRAETLAILLLVPIGLQVTEALPVP